MNKRLYHLHNSFNEHDEYTTDINKIVMIYIDEMAQCSENNILSNTDEEHLRYAEKWLEEIKVLCRAYNRNELDIDKIIEKLNKEYYWNIEVYDKREEV
jgi:hypothetical protein